MSKKYNVLIVGSGNVPTYKKHLEKAGISNVIIAEDSESLEKLVGVDFGNIVDLKNDPPKPPTMLLKNYRTDEPVLIKTGREKRRERRMNNRKIINKPNFYASSSNNQTRVRHQTSKRKF